MTKQRDLIKFLKIHLASKPAIIGLSGGVDSTVVAYLLAKAINPKSVYAYVLPTANNSANDTADAKRTAKLLGIHLTVIHLDRLVETYRLTAGRSFSPAALGNLTARIRMTLLYSQANRLAGLVVGTGNKSELLTGYFTKYGDGGVDLLPLGDIYKTEVWQLAKTLGVPKHIIAKSPSAGLWPGQTDEQELGLTYHELDPILKTIVSGGNLKQYPQSQVARVTTLYQQSMHKRSLPTMAPTQ